jgi:hypothetical protein
VQLSLASFHHKTFMVLRSSPLAKLIFKTLIRVNPLAFSLCGLLYNSSTADDLEHINRRDYSDLIKEWVTTYAPKNYSLY